MEPTMALRQQIFLACIRSQSCPLTQNPLEGNLSTAGSQDEKRNWSLDYSN